MSHKNLDTFAAVAEGLGLTGEIELEILERSEVKEEEERREDEGGGGDDIIDKAAHATSIIPAAAAAACRHPPPITIGLFRDRSGRYECNGTRRDRSPRARPGGQ